MTFEIWHENKCWYKFPTLKEAEEQLKKIERLFKGKFEIRKMWI
jgi:hypothetical protein